MPPTDLEFSLDSEAIGAAAAMRETGDVAPAKLHRLAESDARELYSALRSQTLVAKSLTVALHLDVQGLAGCIYRHAMIHAGAFINTDTQKRYDYCPTCGSELIWPGN